MNSSFGLHDVESIRLGKIYHFKRTDENPFELWTRDIIVSGHGEPYRMTFYSRRCEENLMTPDEKTKSLEGKEVDHGELAHSMA